MDRAATIHERSTKHSPERPRDAEREASAPEPHPAATIDRARSDAGPLPPRDVLKIHRVVGNQAVQRLLEPRRPPVATVTQRRPGTAVIARQDYMERGRAPSHPDVFVPEWGADYKTRESRNRESYQDFKDTIGKHKDRPEIKAASAWAPGQARVKTTVTSDQLGKIVKPAGADAVARIAPMAGRLSEAFETMGIDTATAQAAYIAHYAGETGGKLEEVGAEKRPYAPFQGRGPVQVTWEGNYVQTLAYVEARAEQLEAEAADKDARMAASSAPADREALRAEAERARAQAARLRKAHTEIKRDQTKASDPEYAFLFSAAFMHMSRGVRASQWLGKSASFTGKGSEDFWVTGGNAGMTFEERRRDAVARGDTQLQADMTSAINRGGIKSAVYAKAVSILTKENAITPPPAAPAKP